MDNKLTFFVGCVGVLIATFLFWRYVGLSALYDYEAANDAVRIRIFRRLTVWSVPYTDLVCARLVSLDDPSTRDGISFFALKFGNRLRATYVLLRRRKGFLREIHITPADPERFLSNVLRRVGHPAV
jgi:hypothetical protein